MKDYSLSKSERKDFILGFDITKDGSIIVNFADGKCLPMPYNQKNKRILISKMEDQVNRASENEPKYIAKKEKYAKLFRVMLCSVIVSAIVIFASEKVFVDTIFALILSFSGIYGVSFVSKNIYYSNLLDDLNKNKEFLKLQDKINGNIRSNENVLINVSRNTKKAIENFPEDRTMFDINSFNYVPYSDIEQIIENIDRNERFGFDYTKQEEPARGVARKRIRK